MSKPCPQGIMEHAEALCRARGVRLTSQRRRVLGILCESERPLGAYEILAEMGGNGRAHAPPTVYRALDFLLEQGLVHKLESLHAFVGCNHPEHPHCGQFLICSGCGEVTEIEHHEIDSSLREAAYATGFQPERRVVEIIGTCRHCAPK